MIKSLLFLLLVIPIGSPIKAQDHIEQFRQQYPYARKDAAVCQKQISFINRMDTFSPIERAYAGAFYAVWPEHLQSPLKKLNAFKKGKDYLEQAVKEDPNNMEIRFLRLTVQYNAPSILGYNDKKAEDLRIVLDNFKKTKSLTLRNNIREFLLPTDLLSERQLKVLD
ncbi:hypothetical protein [Sphingobacterium griseoflavum]|uniref:Tetratricopeptide repeat protein n=1 Tax=Sphingobacterium griseoflavum TaxID=1474952 RepID=A0ABQ3I4H8_9SPHI|nr:hypothetical protein [Sphingobacterium griseoflavum]GHE49116.1 hypothetical protein GCM10017764_35160 [Sphingobacterium griseoflavum]